jgi:hypothetical protein
MVYFNAPQARQRRFYIGDPKQINEQECYNQGLQHMQSGTCDLFEVHWHKYNDGCPFINLADGRTSDQTSCYVIKKEGVSP